MLRKLRAILVTAAIWGAAWLPLGVLLGVYMAVTHPSDVVMVEDGQVVGQPFSWSMVWRLAAVCGVWGAVNGIVFATGVLVAERRRRLHEISPWRFAILGGAAAGLLPVYVFVTMMRDDLNPATSFLGVVLIIVLYGAGTAVAMLKAAQRGAPNGQ